MLDFPSHNNVHDAYDDHTEDHRMVNLRLGRTVHRSYIGRRSGCSQPIIIALFIFSVFIFLFFQVANMIPPRPVPPSFAWTSNATRNLTVYVRPFQSTALLQPNNICTNPPYILFVVPSAVNNTRERIAIRQTWGQWAGSNIMKLPVEKVKDFHLIGGMSYKKPSIERLQVPTPRKAKLVFLLGKGKGKESISEVVQLESQLFGDVVVEDFVDSYTNLTLKSVSMLKWVHRNCPSVKFVMKVDDDVFVNVPKLHYSLLNETVTKLPYLAGNLICGARPIHDQWSKWYTPQYMFREGKYPNYLSGTGYVLSADLVEPLMNAALTTPYFHLEDVFLTGICAKKVGVRPVDNLGFSYQPRAVSPCVYKEVIMGHEVLPPDMIKLWNMLNQPHTVAKCHPLSRSKLRSYFPKCSWS